MTARLGLRWRVIAWVALIEALVLALSCIAIVENARIAIAREVEANRDLARDYVIAAVGSLLRGNEPDRVMEFLPGRLDQPRHVRILIVDRRSGLVHQPGQPGLAHDDEAPQWFADLLAPRIEQLSLPVAVAGRTYGEVVISTQPSDEIAEVWEDFRALGLIAALSYIALLIVLSWAVTRGLAPLGRMALAFGRLEAGDFTTRIGPVGTVELAPLAIRFDALADRLAHSIAEKDALNRKLVTVQDRERKAIALELHDEFGPCLFGVRVEARSILDCAERVPGPERAVLIDRARSILAIAEQIQQSNRDLLRRLRPMEIGQLPLAQVLDDLIERMIERAGDIDWQIDIDPDLAGLDETTELTIYRLVQEAVTNILRHARARAAAITVRPKPDAPGWIEVRITDDGCGLPEDRPFGVGLRGMRERAISLGGRFLATGEPGRGTTIQADLPVALPEALPEPLPVAS